MSAREEEQLTSHVVRMCTSQLSDASSAVWIRLSGMRSRSALRSVTWTMSQPVVPGRAGDLAGQAETRQHAVRVVVGAPADVGHHAGRGRRTERLGAQRNRVPLQFLGIGRPPSASRTSRRPAGIAAMLFSSTSMSAASASPRRAVMPSVNCSGVSRACGVHLDTHHRGSHVRNPIRGQEDAMTADNRSRRRGVAGHRAAAAAIEPGGEDYADYRDARRLPAARRRGSPARARSTCPACSAVAARRSRWR